MTRLTSLVFAMSLTTIGWAAEVSLIHDIDLPGRVPVSMCEIDGDAWAFDPMAGVFVSLSDGRILTPPAGSHWSRSVSYGALVYGINSLGQVEQWQPGSDLRVEWAVTQVVDLAVGCDAVWLLYSDGIVERRDPSTGSLQHRWGEGWASAAKINVSDQLEQVVLAPIQGRSVRLYDTSGTHLRTIDGPASTRCADIALGPGGVLAVADRFSGTVELYGPLGDHVAQVAPRGRQPGQAKRPAGLAWQGADLWVFDPSLQRVSVFNVAALDNLVLPVPLAVSPAGGSRSEPERLEFVIVPQRISVIPDQVQVEVGEQDGLVLASTDLGAGADTLRWVPDIAWEPGGHYRWRVRAVSGEFNSGWSAWVNFRTVGLPERFELLPNYPNPFNASTVVAFQVPDVGDRQVRLEVFNTLGQRVRTLQDGVMDPGAQSVVWDGRDDRGAGVASGVYLVRLIHREGVLTRKAVMVK